MAQRGGTKRKLPYDESTEPAEAGAIRDILHSMSITQFEPAVVQQLLEFTHRYASEVFEESRSGTTPQASLIAVDPGTTPSTLIAKIPKR